MKTPTSLILCALAVLALVAVRPVQAAFVAYYDFDEASGTTFADSVGTYDGNVGGDGFNPKTGDPWNVRDDCLGAEGKFGNAFRHYGGDGSSTGVVPSTMISDNKLDGSNARTFSMWFNTSGWSTTSDDPGVQLISCPGGIGGASMFMLRRSQHVHAHPAKLGRPTAYRPDGP